MVSTPIYSLRPAEVFDALATSPDGLSSDEAATRQSLYGQNILSQGAEPADWQKLLGHAAHPLLP